MESRFAQAGELRVHYLEQGRGDPLILLHDWPQTSAAWRRIAPLLANGYSLIAPDMRGMGETSRTVDGYDRDQLAQDVLLLMDALRLSGATLIGHGWGGMIATKIALDHPERVQRLVLLDSPNTGWPATTAHFNWFNDGDRAERLFATRGADVVRALVGGFAARLPRPPECPLEFTSPAFATLMPFAHEQPHADERAGTTALDAYLHAFTTPSGRAALLAPFRALQFHRVLHDPHAEHGERYLALSADEVGAMWSAGQAGREYLDFAPADRFKQYKGAVLWIYNQYLLDFANAFMADDGRPSGDPALESFLRHFPRMEARGIDAGHYFIEEKPEITAQLIRKFLKKN